MYIMEMKCEVGLSLMQVQLKERMQLCEAQRIFLKVPQDTLIPFVSLTIHQYRARDYWKFLKSVKRESNINNNWAVRFRENF